MWYMVRDLMESRVNQRGKGTGWKTSKDEGSGSLAGELYIVIRSRTMAMREMFTPRNEVDSNCTFLSWDTREHT